MPANVDMIEQTDLDEVFSLQFVQWTVPQFCFRVLEKIVRCLQGPVDEQLSMKCFELIHQVASLLAESLVPSVLWEDTSVPARELVRQSSRRFHGPKEYLTDMFLSSDFSP